MSEYLTPTNEITIHYKRPRISEMPKINQTSTAVKHLRPLIDAERIDLRKTGWIMLLTKYNTLIGVAQINDGFRLNYYENIREIYQLMLNTNASNFILFETEPTGLMGYANHQIELKALLKETRNIFNYELIDFIILSSESYFSDWDGVYWV